ncbi:hypothetical protein GCM10009654_55220 [Streptomyces hebeiensis]|uniref:Uncharacterized protein n=1 Tax=Streptomyces hebeiensis TaxID=229486 RepID=A0ABP4FQW4_9ACTN|nr:hypothetical protein [Streptomyces sp. NRRL F-5135]
MNTESAARPEGEGITPDRLLHTGACDEITAEDLALASGRDLTPENIEWAERRLAQRGRAAIEEQLP